MIDSRIPLAEGTILHSSGGDYIIQNIIGAGGTSLVYSALSCEQKNRAIAIKEVFPAHCGAERDPITGSIDGDDEFVRSIKERICVEKEISQILKRRINNIIEIESDLKKVRVNDSSVLLNGQFFVMNNFMERGMKLTDVMDQSQKSGISTAFSALRVIEELLETLRLIHQAGYIHSDVSINNVFFNNPDIERLVFGTASILDFGTACKLNEDGLVCLSKDDIVFTTDGYTCPELNRINPDGGRYIGPQGDIYSTGCLFLRLLVGKNLFAMRVNRIRRNPFKTDIRKITRSDAGRLGLTNNSQLEELNRILLKATEYDTLKRYQTCDEMLGDIRALRKRLEPKEYPLAEMLPILDNREYIGRGDVFTSSVRKHMSDHRLTVITAPAGIGKTEFSISFGLELKKEQKHVLRIVYRDNGGDNLYNCISDLQYSDVSEDKKRSLLNQRQRFERALHFIKGYDVLLIDNFDSDLSIYQMMDEDAFKDLLNDPGESLSIVVFSRQFFPGAIELPPLSDDKCFQLMTAHLYGSAITDQEREAYYQLIKLTARNTLILETIDRFLGNHKEWSAVKMLAALKSNQLPEDQIVSFKNREVKNTNIQKLIESLFDMENMKEEKKAVLSCAAMMQPEGVSSGLFFDLFDDKQHVYINELLDQKYLQSHTDEHNIRYISLHQLLKEVILKSAEKYINNKTIEQFFRRCAAYYSVNLDHTVMSELNGILVSAAGQPSINRYVLIETLFIRGKIHSQLYTDFESRVTINGKQTHEVIEEFLTDNPDDLQMLKYWMDSNSALSITFGRLRQGDMAVKHALIALELLKRPEIEKTYKSKDYQNKMIGFMNNLSYCYGSDKNRQAQLDNVYSCLNYMNGLSADMSPFLVNRTLGLINANGASACAALGKFPEALDFHDQSILSYEKAALIENTDDLQFRIIQEHRSYAMTLLQRGKRLDLKLAAKKLRKASEKLAIVNVSDEKREYEQLRIRLIAMDLMLKNQLSSEQLEAYFKETVYLGDIHLENRVALLVMDEVYTVFLASDLGNLYIYPITGNSLEENEIFSQCDMLMTKSNRTRLKRAIDRSNQIIVFHADLLEEFSEYIDIHEIMDEGITKV